MLDVGTLNYVIQSPGEEFTADLMPREENFVIAPFYVSLVLRKDGEFSLNRFFVTLLSHLQFFPHRPSVPPFEIALTGTSQEVVGICAYQYDRKKNLIPATRSEIELPAAIQIKSNDGQTLAKLHWFPWPSGGAIMREGTAPLDMFLVLVGFAKDEHIFRFGNREYSSVLPVTRAEFLRWPQKLNAKMKNMTAELVVFKEEKISDEGTSTPFIARLLLGIPEVGQRVLPKEAFGSFKAVYPIKELLTLRNLHRELEKTQVIPQELASAFLQTVAHLTEKILGIARTLGLNAAFLLYRDPAYQKGLKNQSDQVLAQYLQQHRATWVMTVAEYVAGSATKRVEISRNIARSDLESIYNGAATLYEELMIYAFQSNAQAGLKIRQLERSERGSKCPYRFNTDLTKSWSLTFSGAPFDEL